MAKPITLANCTDRQMRKLQERLHPVTKRREMIFAAGALMNNILLDELGSPERSQWYDGAVAAGHIPNNPYWPEYGKGIR